MDFSVVSLAERPDLGPAPNELGREPTAVSALEISWVRHRTGR
jgi:hypothetical protein